MSVQTEDICKMVQDGARWCKMVQDGARWCKMVQDGARWCKMVQDGENVNVDLEIVKF